MVNQNQTIYGNRVAVYDRERTICDLIKNKENTDIQVFQNAMKEYMGSGGKNLLNLMNYASKLHVEEEVRRLFRNPIYAGGKFGSASSVC